MLVFRALVKVIKLLNSETSANSLAAAVMLGLFLGLVPFLTLQALLVLAIVLFLRVNLTATMVSLGVFKLVAVALWGTFDRIGVSLIETPSLQGLWIGIYRSPLSLMGLHQASVLGATLIALVAMVPVFLLTRLGINAYRRKMTAIWEKRAASGAKSTSRLYKLYTWIDSPFGAP